MGYKHRVNQGSTHGVQLGDSTAGYNIGSAMGKYTLFVNIS